eukprot:9032478-Alexandrium_andersonii.AAC.1
MVAVIASIDLAPRSACDIVDNPGICAIPRGIGDESKSLGAALAQKTVCACIALGARPQLAGKSRLLGRRLGAKDMMVDAFNSFGLELGGNKVSGPMGAARAQVRRKPRVRFRGAGIGEDCTGNGRELPFP